MKRQNKLILIILLFATATFAQNTLTLIKGAKTKVFDRKSDLTFYTTYINPVGDSLAGEFVARIISLGTDSIKLRPIEVTQSVYKKNKGIWGIQHNYFYRIDTISTVDLNLASIYKIDNERANFNTRMQFFASLSLISALVVSPLISINYSEKKFDLSKYGTITGISIVAFVATLTLSETVGYKRFKLKGEKNVWSIRK